jgi:site-specific recombinase XerD
VAGVLRVQAVDVAGAGRTWTVLGDDRLPVWPIEEFLEHHRVLGSSPNTVRSYAKGLQLWWAYLAREGVGWEDPSVGMLRAFVTWLRTGLSPAVTPIAVGDTGAGYGPAKATVQARLAAVVSFYRFQHDVHGRGAALARASMRQVRSGRYRPMLAHLEGRRDRRASPLRLRTTAPGPPPVLTPAQVGAILKACARFDPEPGEWEGSLRDRLLFDTLAETGVRLGEALCLQHSDWHVGRGQTPFIEVVPREHPHGQRTKGGRPRRIYVSDSLERLYSDYLWLLADLADAAGRVLEDDWFVFVNLQREPRFRALRPESVYALVRRLRRRLREAVPEEVTPHWFRHKHATALLLAGVPEHVVMRRLGHADIQTTIDLYGWVTEDAELRAVAGWRGFCESWRLGDG